MKTVAERRSHFAAKDAEPLVAQLGDGFKRRPPQRDWTTRAVWFERHGELVGLVGDQEEQLTDLVLAHGLFLAEGSKLRLVLPQKWSYASRFRQPWLTSDLEIWTHDGKQATLPKTLSKEQSRDCAGDCEASRTYRLGPAANEWTRELIEWATFHPDLVEAHRRNLRGWSHNGQRVLTIAGKTKVKIRAGIDAKSSPATLFEFIGPLDLADIAKIQSLVAMGISEAKDKKYGSFGEHHLQGQLRRHPNTLRLEEPLLREVPAWRPAKGPEAARGRGFVDLAGVDGAGDIVIVETKLDSDEMLILQGLDYWVWATQKENATWLRDRLYVDPASTIKLLYAVAGKSAGTPQIGKYERAHLKQLDPEIAWRVATISDWNTQGAPTVDMLAPLTAPS